MSITPKKPPIKESIGAQYICFNQMTEDFDWTENFETEVEKTENVKRAAVTENGESNDVYASGIVYDTDVSSGTTDIEVETIAFVADTLARMRGENVDSGGLILSGGNKTRPFFAYGKVVKLKHGKVRYEWFPKCKLAENTDETATKEASFSEQTDTITITAYPFNANEDVKAYVDSSSANFPEGLTEEKFFAKPILTKEGLAAAVSGG